MGSNHHETECVTGALYSWNSELCACVQVYGLISEKCTTSMARVDYYVRKYRTCFNSIDRRNLWHFGLIVAPELTQPRFIDYEKTVILSCYAVTKRVLGLDGDRVMH